MQVAHWHEAERSHMVLALACAGGGRSHVRLAETPLLVLQPVSFPVLRLARCDHVVVTDFGFSR